MQATAKGSSPAFERLAQIMGCKWSMGILDAIERGVTRPSRIEKELEGIAPKVLHRCMNRLEKEGFLVKQTFEEIPPRVEYEFTDEGRKLVELIEHARELSERWSGLEPMQL